VIATAGEASIEALQAAGAENLAGKVLIDVGNALDHSQTPPAIMASTQDSLGERIQAAFPDARVVKALNTVNAEVMVEPGLVPGSHTMFFCGNDEAAKAEVSELLQRFGWPAEEVMDLGGIPAARGLEMYVGFWLRIWEATGSTRFNVRVVTA
jgi:predicted dinucleotide-binding enzyme